MGQPFSHGECQPMSVRSGNAVRGAEEKTFGWMNREKEEVKAIMAQNLGYPVENGTLNFHLV
jgi:hypothetical protein